MLTSQQGWAHSSQRSGEDVVNLTVVRQWTGPWISDGHTHVSPPSWPHLLWNTISFQSFSVIFRAKILSETNGNVSLENLLPFFVSWVKFDMARNLWPTLTTKMTEIRMTARRSWHDGRKVWMSSCLTHYSHLVPAGEVVAHHCWRKVGRDSAAHGGIIRKKIGVNFACLGRVNNGLVFSPPKANGTFRKPLEYSQVQLKMD